MEFILKKELIYIFRKQISSEVILINDRMKSAFYMVKGIFMQSDTRNKKLFLYNNIFILIIGVILRTYHLFTVGFSKPWKLGGLFLEFARQIYQNNYSLPIIIPHYTLDGLPFAYPPLPFYIESLLVFPLELPEFLVVNLLPVIFSIISLILFYVLIKKFIKNKYVQLISISLFSMFPICFEEQLDGGGLAESLGTIFIILLILVFSNFYKRPYHIPGLVITSLVWALTFMASPGSAYLSVFIFLSLFISLIRKERINLSKLILYIISLGLLAMLLSSIYWWPVMRNHGFNLIINSFISQHDEGVFTLGFLIRLAEMNIIENEPMLSVLFLASLCVLAYCNKYEMVLLSILSALIPRETWIMGIIGVLTIGCAIDVIVNKYSIDIFNKRKSEPSYNIIRIIIILPILLRPLYFVLSRELVTDESLDNEQISFLVNMDEIDDFEKNLIIIGNNEFLEWAPYLAEKTVLNVWYGTEFSPQKSTIYDFQKTLLDCKNLTCINQLIGEVFPDLSTSVIIDLFYMNDITIEDVEELRLNESIKIYNERLLYYNLSN